MSWLLDPRLFNFVILTLYALNAIRWGWEGKWWDAGYWVCAFGITFVYTFGHER